MTAAQAANRYGLRIQRSDLAVCPFHNDKSPSMKIDDRYYCFGCGATGDAIDLTAKLLGLSVKEAALRLTEDFHIPQDSTGAPYEPSMQGTEDPSDEPHTQLHGLSIVARYRQLLQANLHAYAPTGMGCDWHPLFCEALQEKDFVDYLFEELLCGDEDYIYQFYRREIEKIEKRFDQTNARGKVETG